MWNWIGRVFGADKDRPISLFWRIFGTSVIGVVLALAGSAVLASNMAAVTTKRALNERLILAETIAARIDDYLNSQIETAQLTVRMSGIDVATAAPAERQRLAEQMRANLGSAAFYVALISPERAVLALDPPLPEVLAHDWSSAPCVASVYATGQPVITRSGMLGISEPMVAMVVGIQDRSGEITGVAFAALDLTDPAFTALLQPLALGETGFAAVVDSAAVILGSSRPEMQWQTSDYGNTCANLVMQGEPTVQACHSCHTGPGGEQTPRADIMAFAPLTAGHWAVTVNQSQEEVFADANHLKQRFTWLSGGIFVLTLGGGWLLARRMVSPIRKLTAACQDITAGNLDAFIPPAGQDEIGALSKAFDAMRVQAKTSITDLATARTELEERVVERTEELLESQSQLLAANRLLQEKEEGRRLLLREVISAQEEERRRIARELHDETSQALTALTLGLETATMAPAAKTDDVKKRLVPLKKIAGEMLVEIQRMIRDLRPSVLDDLGLISAIDWYAEVRLKSQGVGVEWEVCGEERRLPTEIETAVFRLAQEAISNIARHAGAKHVRLSLDFQPTGLMLSVRDDGCGFDSDRAFTDAMAAGAYGLAGMQERIELLEGRLSIHSRPDSGTLVEAYIPLDDAQYSGPTSNSELEMRAGAQAS